MKTKKLLFTSLFSLSFLFTNAQTIATAALTSGGLDAGTISGVQSGYNGSTFYGHKAGKANTSSGFANSFFGSNSGSTNTTGSSNTFLGTNSGWGNTNGSGNVSIGVGAGQSNVGGNSNVYIGTGSGFEESNDHSGNVFIGASAGFTENASNRLVIGNYEDKQLIWGDFEKNLLKLNGKVGVGYNFGEFPSTSGTSNVSKYNLFVKGGILTEEIRVSLSSTWADYVFNKEYKLATLNEVENYIKQNGHLQNMPSAKEVAENGLEVGEIIKKQQEKIEELTLYMIKQNKETEELKALVKNLVEKNK